MPELTISVSDKAQKVLNQFKKGMGYDDEGIIIQEALYAISECLEAYENSDPARVKGILAIFERFND